MRSSGAWKPSFGEPRLGGMRPLVGDPTGVDARHQNAIGVQVASARARQHVHGGLRHVRVRMPCALVDPAELTFHRRHVHDVLATRGRRRHRCAQPAHQHERRDQVAQLHFEQLDGIDLVHAPGPAVDRVEVGHQAAGVDRGLLGDPLERRRPAGQCEGGQRMRRAAHASRDAHRLRRARRPPSSRVRSTPGRGPSGSGALSAAMSCA